MELLLRGALKQSRQAGGIQFLVPREVRGADPLPPAADQLQVTLLAAKQIIQDADHPGHRGGSVIQVGHLLHRPGQPAKRVVRQIVAVCQAGLVQRHGQTIHFPHDP